MITIIRSIEDAWATKKCNNEYGEYWYLYGPRGHVPTRSEWETMKEMIDEFYVLASDEDIEKINRECDEEIQREIEESNKIFYENVAAQESPEPGYIYLIQGENTPWCKIGISERPKKRLKQIGAKSPFKLRLIAAHKVPDVVDAEQGWHQLFEDKRAEGEWFELSDDDIALFVESRGMLRTTGEGA